MGRRQLSEQQIAQALRQHEAGTPVAEIIRIHNVVGQLGVVLGNGGDLMTGLPWQSAHDGVRFQHEPLRLLVVIEATRHAVQQIIEKHASVRDLVSNGWLLLVVLENEQCYRWYTTGAWEIEPLAA